MTRSNDHRSPRAAPVGHWAFVYDRPPDPADDGDPAGWWRQGRRPAGRPRSPRGTADTGRDLLRTIRNRWMVVLAVVALALVGAGVFTTLRPAEYTVDMKMYVAAQAGPATSPEAAYQGSLLSQQRVLAYVDLVDSPQVARAVVAQLRLPDSPDAIARSISAESATDSVIIDVSVVADTPAKAAAIANALAEVFPRLVGDLERTADPGSAPPVTVRAVEPIEVPTDPSTPGLAIMLSLGLLVGLAVGAAVAVLLDALDRTVSTPEALSDAAGAPNLGVLHHDPGVRNGSLVLDSVGRPAGESFRQLRTNLQFVDLDRPRRLLVVTSALAGEGKTTTVSNLAAAFSAVQTRVLVIDADLRRPRLATVLGLEPSVGLTDVLANRASLAAAVQRSVLGQFDVLAAGTLPPNPSEVLASRQMRTLLGQVRDRYDMVLVDAPPLLPVTDAAVLATRTDGAILLARHKKDTAEQIRTAADMLAVISAPLLGTIMTMVPRGAGPASEAYRSYEPDEVSSSAVPTPVPPPAAPVPAPRPVRLPDYMSPGPAASTRPPSNGAGMRTPVPPVVPPVRPTFPATQAAPASVSTGVGGDTVQIPVGEKLPTGAPGRVEDTRPSPAARTGQATGTTAGAENGADTENAAGEKSAGNAKNAADAESGAGDA